MIQTPKQRQNLARALRAKAQPVKYDTRYADEAEAIRAFAEEFRAMLYEEDPNQEYHPYFNNRNAREPWEREAR